MLRSIKDSPEAKVCRDSNVVRNFSKVLKNIPEMDRKIAVGISQYDGKQLASAVAAEQIMFRGSNPVSR